MSPPDSHDEKPEIAAEKKVEPAKPTEPAVKLPAASTAPGVASAPKPHAPVAVPHAPPPKSALGATRPASPFRGGTLPLPGAIGAAKPSVTHPTESPTAVTPIADHSATPAIAPVTDHPTKPAVAPIVDHAAKSAGTPSAREPAKPIAVAPTDHSAKSAATAVPPTAHPHVVATDPNEPAKPVVAAPTDHSANPAVTPTANEPAKPVVAPMAGQPLVAPNAPTDHSANPAVTPTVNEPAKPAVAPMADPAAKTALGMPSLNAGPGAPRVPKLPIPLRSAESTHKHGALSEATSAALLDATRMSAERESLIPIDGQDIAVADVAESSPKSSSSPFRAPTPPPPPLAALDSSHRTPSALRAATPAPTAPSARVPNAPAAKRSAFKPIQTRGLLSIPPPPSSSPSQLAAGLFRPPELVLAPPKEPRSAASRATIAIAFSTLVALSSLVFVAVFLARMKPPPPQTVVMIAPAAVAPAPPPVETPVARPAPVVPPPPVHARRGPATRGHVAPGRTTTTAAQNDTEEEEPDPTAARNACARNCHGDIDCILRCTASTAAATRAPEPASNDNADLPATPSRSDVEGAMQSINVEVRRCANGRSGNVSVDLTVAASGRTTTAVVAPPFSGTPEGSCIARLVRTLRFEPFSRPFFRVSHVYRVD